MVRYIVLLMLWWLVCGICLAQTDGEFKVRKGNGEKEPTPNRVIVDTALPTYTAPVNPRALRNNNEPLQIYWYQWALKATDSVRIAIIQNSGVTLTAVEPRNNWQQGRVLSFKMDVTTNGITEKFVANSYTLTTGMQNAIANITLSSTITFHNVVCQKGGASPDAVVLGPFVLYIKE